MVYFFSSNTSICIRYPGSFCFSLQVNAALCIQWGDANCFSFLISATEICSCFLKLNRQKPQKQPGSHEDTFTSYSGVWKEVVESTGLAQCSLAACWPPPISTPWCQQCTGGSGIFWFLFYVTGNTHFSMGQWRHNSTELYLLHRIPEQIRELFTCYKEEQFSWIKHSLPLSKLEHSMEITLFTSSMELRWCFSQYWHTAIKPHYLCYPCSMIEP